MKESHRRSVAKALSWRVIATFITGFVALYITGELRLAVEIGFIDTIAKLVVYYAHERTWASIRYGEIKPPEYTI